jgi:hypothetical protein
MIVRQLDRMDDATRLGYERAAETFLKEQE